MINPFQVVILGSGAALPTPKRAPSAQYIICNNRHLLIDCGEGTQTQMRRFGVHFQKITQIFISHLHGDHYFGLIGLLSTMNLLGRNQGLTVYGPPELDAILKMQFEVAYTPLNFQMQFVPLCSPQKEVIFEDKLVKVSAFPMKHRIKTFGFFIEEKGMELMLNFSALSDAGVKKEFYRILKLGNDIELLDGTLLRYADFTLPAPPPRSYAYCSDTAPFDNLFSFIKGTSVLYHEATFTNQHKNRAKETAHSTAEQAAKIALKLGVKKLYLGHFSSRYANGDVHLSEATAIFPNTEVVEDGTKFTVD